MSSSSQSLSSHWVESVSKTLSKETNLQLRAAEAEKQALRAAMLQSLAKSASALKRFQIFYPHPNRNEGQHHQL